jgi:cyclic dehypoxanthinyl futalosine synthase
MGISRKEALECFQSDDLIGIGMEAEAVRRRLHPEGVVSYAIEAAIDCATVMGGGTREGNQPAVGCAHRLFDEIGETIELGSTGVRLCGGVGYALKSSDMEWFEGLLRGVRQRFPSLWIETLSAAEILSLANGCGLGLRETIARLGDAGMDSIAGDNAASFGGADSLGVAVQERIERPRCSPSRCSAAEWIAVHRAAHGLGMRTVATMLFNTGETGANETLEQRVDLLTAVRQLQQETGGFTAFIPQSLPSRNPATGGWEEPTAVEQLKTLAIVRVFLDNIQNIQWSGAAQGLKVLQMGLRFGANDAGSVTPVAHGATKWSGEKVVNGATAAGVESAAAAANHPSEEDLRRIIRDAGFQPVQRDTSYRMMFLN